MQRGYDGLITQGFHLGRVGQIAAVHDNTVWIKTEGWILRLPKTFVASRKAEHATGLPEVEIDACHCPTDTRHDLYQCTQCGFLEETFTFIPLEESDAEGLRMMFNRVCHYCAQKGANQS